MTASITLTVSDASDSRLLKFYWWRNDTHFSESYLVKREDVVGASEKLIDIFQTQVGLNESKPNADALRNIAHEGWDLWCIVSGDHRAPIEEELGCLQDSAPQGSHAHINISIICDGGLKVPWGLMFSGDPTPIDTADLTSKNAPFFHSTFDVSVFTTNYSHGDRENRCMSKGNLVKIFARDFNALPAGFSPTYSTPDVSPITRSHFREAFLKAGKSSRLVYFFGHSNPKAGIILGDQKGFIEPIDIRSWLARLGIERPKGLLIINSCNSLRQNTATKWTDVAMIPRFHGFVGTEVDVNPKKAFNFGEDLLNNLLNDNSTLANALRKTREADWPFGLGYTAYCNIDASIES